MTEGRRRRGWEGEVSGKGVVWEGRGVFGERRVSDGEDESAAERKRRRWGGSEVGGWGGSDARGKEGGGFADGWREERRKEDAAQENPYSLKDWRKGEKVVRKSNDADAGTDRQTDRDPDRHTDRHTGREAVQR